jgi:hypothetical protein
VYSLRDSAYKVAILFSFVASGLFVYKVLGRLLLGIVGITHVTDLPPEVERQLGILCYWTLTMAAIWLVALLLALVEVSTKRRNKRLTVYAMLPIVGAGVVYGITWLALFILIPR